MARIIRSSRVAKDLTGMYRRWAYNAHDCCVTAEIDQNLEPRRDAVSRRIYGFEMACQSPAMAMQLRGILVDDLARQEGLTGLKKEEKGLERALNKRLLEGSCRWDGTQLNVGHKPNQCEPGRARHKWPKDIADKYRKCEICGADRIVPKPFNPRSDDQTAHLFYDIFDVPKQRNKKGQVSTDKDCLDRIARGWPGMAGFVRCIKEARHIRKLIATLQSGVSADGRMRSSYNVGATVDSRWSSSESNRHEGTNLQNIPEKLRNIFIPDPGFEMFYADLEQAESNCIAHLAGDKKYIAAHATGNVHVVAGRIFWPNLPWTGDFAKDKAYMKETVPSWATHLPYYDCSKRNQHGLNYGLSPQGIARQAHIPLSEAKDAYRRYFTEYPHIRAYHNEVSQELRNTGELSTPLGRRRQFFGRLWDKHTIRQGYAMRPQSMVAEILNCCLWRIWNEMDPSRVQLLQQGHDAILGQVREGDDEALEMIKRLMTIPVEVTDGQGITRTMTIGVDLKRGRNWRDLT